MFRFLLPTILISLCIGLPCWIAQSFAHDTFYPHHREDFESMTRRRELRGVVLLSTTAFLLVLGTVVYIGLRKSKDVNESNRDETETVQERLVAAANTAAAAAIHALNTGESIPKAAETALTTYANVSGITWQLRSHRQSPTETVPYHIRCKIGYDIVTLSITPEVVQLQVEHGGGSSQTKHKAKTVIRIADAEEIQGRGGKNSVSSGRESIDE